MARLDTAHLSFCFLDILGNYLVWFGFLFLSCKVIVLDSNYGEKHESIIKYVSETEEGKMSVLSFQVDMLHAL